MLVAWQGSPISTSEQRDARRGEIRSVGHRRRSFQTVVATPKESARRLSRVISGDDTTLYSTLCSLLTVLIVGWGIAAIVCGLARRRPGLSLAAPLVVAAGARVLAAGILSSSNSLARLRGPDDVGFVEQARALHGQDLLPGSGPLASELHLDLLGLTLNTFGPAEAFSFRLLNIGFAVAGIALIAGAVYDLAGPKAALVACWLAALEPASIFFSGVIQKESLMILAEGITVFGGVRMWKRRDPAAVALLVLGCAVAVLTRSYAGAFLAAAGVALTLHAALRRAGPAHQRAWPLAGTACTVAVVGLGLAAARSDALLAQLQSQQDFYAADASNLRLPRVDVSTPGGAAAALPRRTVDLLMRPLPWQLENTSQQLAVVGTLVGWMLIIAVVWLVTIDRRGASQRGPPVAYFLIAVTVAYALSVSNGGTGFRYRTHVVLLLTALAAALGGDRLGRVMLRMPAPLLRLSRSSPL